MAKWTEIDIYTGLVKKVDEDVPANFAGQGSKVALPPDAQMKKKKKLLDARTKVYRQHRERLEKLRAQREAKRKSMKEHKGTTPHKHPHEDNEVEEGLENSPNPANKQHLCAKNVVHEEWGDGQCIATQHADPDEEGNVAWYDVMFEHGIEKGVLITELKVTKSEGHMHASYNGNKKKKEEVSKTETGKKAAAIDLKPKIDD